jgi:hypothetical protein
MTGAPATARTAALFRPRARRSSAPCWCWGSSRAPHHLRSRRRASRRSSTPRWSLADERVDRLDKHIVAQDNVIVAHVDLTNPHHHLEPLAAHRRLETPTSAPSRSAHGPPSTTSSPSPRARPTAAAAATTPSGAPDAPLLAAQLLRHDRGAPPPALRHPRGLRSRIDQKSLLQLPQRAPRAGATSWSPGTTCPASCTRSCRGSTATSTAATAA